MMTEDLQVSEVETYVYGVMRAGAADVEATRGVGPLGSPLRTVTCGSVSAVVSDVPAGELAATRDDLFRHTEILQSLTQASTVLPMRFGTIMPDEQSVTAHLLEARSDELERLLTMLEGKVELTLSASYHESVLREVVTESPEILRLNQRLGGMSPEAGYYERIRLGELVAAALAAKRERDGAAIIDRLQSHAVELVTGEPAHERAVLSAAFLVEEQKVAQFDAAAAKVAEERADRMRFRYTGPLPPFSFVDLEGSPAWD